MSNYNLSDYPTQESLYEFAKSNDIAAVKRLLHQYVQEGQPDGFCDESTTRKMCGIASSGLEGRAFDDNDYMSSKHGVDLYMSMWGVLDE